MQSQNKAQIIGRKQNICLEYGQISRRWLEVLLVSDIQIQNQTALTLWQTSDFTSFKARSDMTHPQDQMTQNLQEKITTDPGMREI